MNDLLRTVLYMAILTWLCLMTASLIRWRAWSAKGMNTALGNRHDAPPVGALQGRADRAAQNTLENFVLFAAVALIAQAAGAASGRATLGAEIFFWGRIVYFAVYLIGVSYLRSIVYGASMVGLVMMVSALL
jgi:uncharacterized MAPEG superfamily protein